MNNVGMHRKSIRNPWKNPAAVLQIHQDTRHNGIMTTTALGVKHVSFIHKIIIRANRLVFWSYFWLFVLLEKLKSLESSRNYLHLMEPKGSSPRWQQSATGPYLESLKSSPQHDNAYRLKSILLLSPIYDRSPTSSPLFGLTNYNFVQIYRPSQASSTPCSLILLLW